VFAGRQNSELIFWEPSGRAIAERCWFRLCVARDVARCCAVLRGMLRGMLRKRCAALQNQTQWKKNGFLNFSFRMLREVLRDFFFC